MESMRVSAFKRTGYLIIMNLTDTHDKKIKSQGILDKSFSILTACEGNEEGEDCRPVQEEPEPIDEEATILVDEK